MILQVPPLRILGPKNCYKERVKDFSSGKRILALHTSKQYQQVFQLSQRSVQNFGEQAERFFTLETSKKRLCNLPAQKERVCTHSDVLYKQQNLPCFRLSVVYPSLL